MTDKHTLVGAMPWRAAIWQQSGATDTVCIKDAHGNEIVGWHGFDGVPGTKAGIRARCRLIVRAVNAYPDLATRITALEAREAELVEALTECAAEIRVMSEWANGPTAETYAALHSKCAATLAKHQEGEGK